MEIENNLFPRIREQSSIINETSDVGDLSISSVQTDHNYHINGIVDNNNQDLLAGSRINEELDLVRAPKIGVIQRHFSYKKQEIGENEGIGRKLQIDESEDFDQEDQSDDEGQFEEALRLEEDPHEIEEREKQPELIEKNTNEIVQQINHKVPQILDFSSPQNLKEKLSKRLDLHNSFGEKKSNSFGDKLSSFFGNKLSNSFEGKSLKFQEKLSNSFGEKSSNFNEKLSNCSADKLSKRIGARLSSTCIVKSSNFEQKLSNNFAEKLSNSLVSRSSPSFGEKSSKFEEKLSNNFAEKLSNSLGPRLSSNFGEKSSNFEDKLSNNFAEKLSKSLGPRLSPNFEEKLSNNLTRKLSKTLGPRSSQKFIEKSLNFEEKSSNSNNFLVRLPPRFEERSPSPEDRSKNIEETFLQNYEEDSSEPEEETYEEKYDLKSCTVEITRCDKIWDTLKLIKILQESQEFSEEADCNEKEDYDDDDDEYNNYPGEGSSNPTEMDSSSSPMAPYIQYQPVLGNGNAALPNFQFSVKSTRPLWHCYTCGRQYSHRSTLRDHSERVHNIIIPSMRPPTTSTVVKKYDSSKSIHDTSSTNDDDSLMDIADDSQDYNDMIDDSSDITESSKTSSNTASTTTAAALTSSLIVSKDGRSNCPYCERSYSDKYNLNYHLEKAHGFLGLIKHRPSSMRWRTVNQAAMSVHRCHICAKHFYGDDKLKDHMQKEHGVSLDNLRNRINKKLQGLKSARPQIQQQVQKEIEKEKVEEKRGGRGGDYVAKEVIAPIDEMENNENDEDAVVVAAAEKKRQSLYECPVCKKQYVDKISWKIHLKKLHGILLPQGRRTRVELEDYLKSLKLGCKKTMLQGGMKKKKAIRGNFECKICGAKFFRAVYYDSHMEKHEDGLLPGSTTKTTTTTQEKEEDEDEEEEEETTTINKLPPTKTTTTTKTKQSNKKISDCEYCGKVFRLSRNLAAHRPRCKLITKYRNSRRQTSKKQTFICNTCGKTYTSDSHLVRHLKDAHDIKIPLGVNRHPKEDIINDPPQKEKSLNQPLPLSRSLRAKERVNYDENIQVTTTIKSPVAHDKTLQIRQSEFKKIPDTPEEDGTQVGLIQCILCNRHCKKIYKHFVEYHKIRHPETVIAQCKPSTIVDFYAQEGHGLKRSAREELELKKLAQEGGHPGGKKSAQDGNTGKRSASLAERRGVKRSPSLPELDKCVPSPPERKIRLDRSAVVPVDNDDDDNDDDDDDDDDDEDHRDDKNIDEKIKSVTPRRGRRPHSTAIPTTFPVPGPYRLFELLSENNQSFYKCKYCDYRTYNYKQACGHQAAHPVEYHQSKGRRTPMTTDKNLPQPSSRKTRSTIRILEEVKFQCSICDRLFRNSEVLASHKISCTPRLSLDLPLLDANDTRESSDRDSGIGISITIKKKNDSYEIVSRDSSGERKPDDELSADSILTNNTPIDSIDDSNKNCNTRGGLDDNLNDKISHKSNGDDNDDKNKYEFNHDKNFIRNHHDLQLNSTILKIDTLVNLCTNVMKKSGKLGRLQCPICWVKWSSKKSLATHRRVHRPNHYRASL